MKDFEVLAKPGFLIVSETVSKICFLDIKCSESLASEAGVSSDGLNNKMHPFFKNRTPIIVRKTRGKNLEKSSVSEGIKTLGKNDT